MPFMYYAQAENLTELCSPIPAEDSLPSLHFSRLTANVPRGADKPASRRMDRLHEPLQTL